MKDSPKKSITTTVTGTAAIILGLAAIAYFSYKDAEKTRDKNAINVAKNEYKIKQDSIEHAYNREKNALHNTFLAEYDSIKESRKPNAEKYSDVEKLITKMDSAREAATINYLNAIRKQAQKRDSIIAEHTR